MIPELGNFALMIAAVVALMQGVLPIAGTLVRQPQMQITLQSLARPTAA
jgi:cytochrome c biogenesis factor